MDNHCAIYDNKMDNKKALILTAYVILSVLTVAIVPCLAVILMTGNL